jgi:hypothetical protein
MRNKTLCAVLLAGFAVMAGLFAGSIYAGEPVLPAWVERSNAMAYEVMESNADFAPEFSAQTGVDGFDDGVFDLKPGRAERVVAVAEDNIRGLEERLESEQDPRVRQDIGIMIQSQEDRIEQTRVNEAHVLPYVNVTRLVFAGFDGLLDKQVPGERQQAALIRLQRYTGEAEGYEPITHLAVERSAARFDDGLIMPFRGEVEQDLERAPVFIEGLSSLFTGSGLEGWEDSLAMFQRQLTEYNEWIAAEILPRSRASATLPRELYELSLKNFGVDESPERLMEMGQVAFMNIRNEMIALAPLVAEQKGYETNDYREVIRLLKADQIYGEDLMSAYRDVMARLDEIIAAEGLASLPNEAARIRMATAAETAQLPAAHLDTPRLVGNTGEFPEFIVPKIEQNQDGSWPQSDYAFPAMMWTLSAHEARPGHEMQFTTMLRGGVSTARAVFAFNSANVEGWGLYAEAIAKPYMPLDGQLMSLQARLLRAARLWLDPMLNLGLTSPEEAKRILMLEVMEDEPSAQTEIDRYTFMMPGQATAYYYGYSKLIALRAATEMRLKSEFDAKEFNDFILAQGLLPPVILRQAVEESLVVGDSGEITSP